MIWKLFLLSSLIISPINCEIKKSNVYAGAAGHGNSGHFDAHHSGSYGHHGWGHGVGY